MASRIWVGWPAWCKAYGLPDPSPEFKFSKTRNYLLDCAWPNHKVGVEVQGGLRSGRKAGHFAHDSYAMRRRDMEKINLAQAEGWRILQFEWKDINSGSAVELIKDVLERSADAQR